MLSDRTRIFPVFGEPRSLNVLDVRHLSWDEQLTTVCLQGMVNRVEPRIYLIFDDDVDRLWLREYHDQYGIKQVEVKSLMDLLRLFVDELKGFVVYDDRMLHSANVAMTFGSVHGAVPASPLMAESLSQVGLGKVKDLRGMWRSRVEAYEWELEALMPQCNPRVVGSMCVDPGWLRPLHHVRDYLVAVRAFSFDLSTKALHRRENRLFDKILGRLTSLGMLLGWHCSRDLESENVARAARNGLFVLCSLKSPNLSVHSGVKANREYRQGHAAGDTVKVEDKVYVTFVQSDGDAVWAMSNFQNRNWLDGQRGKFPYTWEVQPLLFDLAPGILEYYYRTATPNDYLIAGPSGAGYTYPGLSRRLEAYLEQTRAYFRLCDIKAALIMNQDPSICYREVEDPELPNKMVHELGAPCGFLHGYSGSGFVPTIFVDGVPWVHTAEYVDGSSSVLEEVRKFGSGCHSRPLFVSVHVRENTPMETLSGTVDKLDPAVYKVVKLDEFMVALRRAHEEDRFTEAFPEREFLKESLKKQGKQSWETHYKAISRLEKIVGLDPGKMFEEFTKAGYDIREEELPDALGYDGIEALLYLVRSALLLRGLPVNYRGRSVREFLREYVDLPNLDVVRDAHKLWHEWEGVEGHLGLDDMREMVRRVVDFALILHKRLSSEQ